MTSAQDEGAATIPLQIQEEDIPPLVGKTALVTGTFGLPNPRRSVITRVTGGASGIGLAAVHILIAKGAKAFILDLAPPTSGTPSNATFIKCDITSWQDLKAAFKEAGKVDIAIANASVSEEQDYFEDVYDQAGELAEPKYEVIEVNYRGVLNFVKLAISYMRKQGKGGSIVITSSATAYSPEQSLPVYSATKLAVSISNKAKISSDYHQDRRCANNSIPIAHWTRSRSPFKAFEGRYNN